MDLSTTYLGFKLRTPIVPSASPLSEDLDHIKQMEDAGASAVVLHSLFEEQVGSQRTDAYLRKIEGAKAWVRIPIIASLNTSTLMNWMGLARRIQEAGADALELNIYTIPTDLALKGEVVEETHLRILEGVKAEVSFPVAVKLSPFFSNLANLAKRLDDVGADGLVLFNRFYQPDIDLDHLRVTSDISFNAPNEARLALRWIAILYGRIQADLAATTGIHNGLDVLKMVLAGADVAMVCSALLERGILHLTVIEQQMRAWMQEHGHESLEALKGRLSHQHSSDPSAYERAQYVHALTTWITSST
jgi:dihydroorotate dehydrogenase (fumarate)